MSLLTRAGATAAGGVVSAGLLVHLVSQTEALGSGQRLVAITLVSIAAAIGAAFAIYLTLRPLRQLSDSIGALNADPQLLRRLGARTDEIGLLANATLDAQQRLEERNCALTRAYATVTESEQRLARIVENMAEGFLIVYADGQIHSANPSAHRLFGYESGALLDHNLRSLGWGEAGQTATWLARCADDCAGGATLVLSGRMHCGESRAVETGVSRVAQDGRDLYCLLVRDVTEQNRMARELRESQAFLHSVVDLMPVPVFIKEASSLTFTLVNRAMETLTGVSRAAYLDRSYRELDVDPRQAAEFIRAERALADGESRGLCHKQTLETPAGARHVRGSTIALRDSTGRVSHLLGVLEDLTEETAIQEELQAARHRAESANRAKSAFLANVGHELRTPLNAILGYSDMLEELARAENRDRDSADLQRIHSAATSLLTIINEILDLSRSESVRESARAPVDVARLLREVNAIAEPLVRGNGNVYQVSGTHTAPYVSNEPKIRAILVNLLGNAAKFTRGGTVTLAYRIDQDNAWFRVKDTGVGIAPEAQAEIFEPFVQGDSSIGRQYGGSGLGLALCRRYCEQLDAVLDLVSAPGSGSTVTITIPSAALAPETAAEVPPPSALLATDPR